MTNAKISRVDTEPESIEIVGARATDAAQETTAGSRIIVGGTNDVGVAAVAVNRLEKGDQVVLLPDSLNNALDDDLLLAASKAFIIDEETAIQREGSGSFQGDWNLVCYSSGSTGTPRPIGLRREQLRTTARWYKQVYDLSQDSLIVSPLPSTYNFSFIAGAYTTSVVGATYCVANETNGMIDLLTSPPPEYDRVIGLLNPIVLEEISERSPTVDDRVLMDTGGAPMSRHAVQWFRENVGDLREGYGLTETCSLTHFDSDGSEQSAGTVGTERPGVTVDIAGGDGKPVMSITAPNIGVELSEGGQPKSSWPSTIETDDLGEVDKHGRLRLLGRDADTRINGRWPKDTLDAIGPILGPKCAIVRHLSEKKVIVRLWQRVESSLVDRIRTRIVNELAIDPRNIVIETTEGELLDSYKIPYNASDKEG